MLQIWEDRTLLSPWAGIYIAWLLRKTKSFKKAVVHWLQTSPDQTFRKLQQTWLSCLFTTIGYTNMRFTNTLSVLCRKSSCRILNLKKMKTEVVPSPTGLGISGPMNSLLGLLVVAGWPGKSYSRIHINRQWPSDVLLLSAAPHCPR